MTNGSSMKVKSIAECSPWSILQYFAIIGLEKQFLVFLKVVVLHRFYCNFSTHRVVKTVLYMSLLVDTLCLGFAYRYGSSLSAQKPGSSNTFLVLAFVKIVLSLLLIQVGQLSSVTTQLVLVKYTQG